MGKLWIPEGLSNRAIEVFTDLEYARYKLKVFEKQQELLMFEISRAKVAVDQMLGMVSNLRSRSSKIVSFKEFQKIQDGIDHARTLEKKWSDTLKRYQSDTEEIRFQIETLQSLFDKIKHDGKVLQFADAKRKRSKN